METIVGRMAARLTGDSSDFNRAADSAGDSVQSFDRKVEDSNKTLQRHAGFVGNATTAFAKLGATVGKIALTALIADLAATVGVLTLATAESIKFESSFAGIQKTMEATPAEFNAIRDSIRQLSKEIPVNVNELNKIGEAAGQLGIHKENLTGFIETIAKISVTTNMTADEAADAFARFSNIMQTPQDQISNLGSAVVALGNNFAGTESEILAMAMRLAGAGHTVGMTEGDVLGLATALSSVGIEAEAGGSSFSKVMIEMADAVSGNSKKARQMLQDMAQVMGVSATELAQKFKTDAAGAVIDLVTSLGKLQKQGADVFGILESLGIEDIRMRDAILRAAGASDIFTDAIRIGNEALEENTALNEEASKRFETTESKIQLAENAARDAAITIGGPLKDAFAELLVAFTDTVAGGDDVKRVVEEFTPVIHDATEVLKPLIKGFATDAPGAFETFGAAILTLKGYLDVFGRTLDIVGTKLGTFSEPAGRLKDAVGEALFSDFGADVERQKAALRGEKYEFPHERADRQEQLYRSTGMSEHQIREMAERGLGPGLPANNLPSSGDYIMSGGVPVLKDQAEQRLRDAEEAARIWREAQSIETEVTGEMAQPPGAADTFRGSAPKTKEERIAEERAAAKAAKDAETAANKAQREAEAAAKKAQREAEQAAARYAELVTSFNRTIAEAGYAVEEGLGKNAQKAQQALGDIFEVGASGSEGAALARTVSELIKQAREAGVPEAEAMGAELVAATSRAVVERTPEAKAAAQAMIDQINAGILEASRLTADTFGKAFDREALAFQLGTTGAAIMEALDKAINVGGPKTIDSLAKAVAGMRRTLINDLDPQAAAELGGQMMELLAQAIDEKSPEAIQALEDFLRQLNQLLPLEKAGQAMADRINKAIDEAAERIKEIQDTAAKKITEAQNQLTESRTLRGARENVATTQEAALKTATEAADAERLAYKDMRDEQHVLDARRLEDAELIHRRQLEDTKMLKDFNDAMKLNNQHRTTGMSGAALADLRRRGAAGGFDVGPRADPALDARKAFEAQKKALGEARAIEDEEIKRRQGIEDEARKQRLKERGEDSDFDKGLAAGLEQFRKDQAKDRQAFEDAQADEALKREEARTLAASQDQIDKANDNLVKIEAAEADKFGKLEAQLTALADVGLAAVATAGDNALNGMSDDADHTLMTLLAAEAVANRMNGKGAPGPDSEDSGDDGAGGQVTEGPDIGVAGEDLPTKEAVPLASGGVVYRPTLARIAERHVPEAIAPLSSLQAMINQAAYAGMAQSAMISQPTGGVGPHIELYNPQFYGAGGPKAFTRQVGRDLTNDARDKQAVQGD